VGLADALGFAGREIERKKAAAQRQDRTATSAQDKGTNRLRQCPGLLAPVGLHPMNGRPIGIDPIEALLFNIP
jgi:hypothetical protein